MTGTSNHGEELLRRIRALAAAKAIDVTQHARQEMAAEAISADDPLATIAGGHILENYPGDRGGAGFLLGGTTVASRPLHVVCASRPQTHIMITVYEPKPPKGSMPTQRRRS